MVFLGDGHVDLIVADQGDPTTGTGQGLTLFQDDGPGQFNSAGTITVGSAPSALAVGDFTGDGVLDLAVADANSDDVYILLNKGNGTFLAPQAYPVGSVPLGLVAVRDFGNGHMLIWQPPTRTRTTSQCCWAMETVPSGRRCGSRPGAFPQHLWQPALAGTIAPTWRSLTSVPMTSPCSWGEETALSRTR